MPKDLPLLQRPPLSERVFPWGKLQVTRLDLLLLLDNRLAVIRHHTAQCLRHDAKIGRDTLG